MIAVSLSPGTGRGKPRFIKPIRVFMNIILIKYAFAYDGRFRLIASHAANRNLMNASNEPYVSHSYH